MIQFILKLIAAPLLGSLVDAYKARLKHAGEQDVLAVDLAKAEILAEIEARKVASSIIIAEQGRWYTAAIRPLIALPVAILLAKIFVWDKVLGWGTTDALDANLWNVVMVIIGSYFGGRSFEKVAQVFARRK